MATEIMKVAGDGQRRLVGLSSLRVLSGVAECLGILSEADCRLKGILTGYSGMETLEQMLLKMVAVVRA